MQPIIENFQNHKYLNLETFRKSGVGVRTPVWFVREGDALYVWTQANSGKAKRIRNNPRVRVAPCTARGDLLGEWVEAHAEVDASPAALKHVQKRMTAKYGLAYRGFQLMGKLQRAQYTTLKITFPDQSAN